MGVWKELVGRRIAALSWWRIWEYFFFGHTNVKWCRCSLANGTIGGVYPYWAEPELLLPSEDKVSLL